MIFTFQKQPLITRPYFEVELDSFQGECLVELNLSVSECRRVNSYRQTIKDRNTLIKSLSEENSIILTLLEEGVF